MFSGSEIAYVAANRLRVETRARDKGLRGQIATGFIQDLGKLLTTTLVGNNLALVAYSTAMAILLEPGLDHFFHQTLGLADPLATGATLITQTFIAAVVVLFISEIIPKSVMREFPNRAVFLLAVPLRFTYIILWPIIALAGFLARLLSRAFGAESESLPRILRRDFELLIRRGNGDSVLDLDEEGQTILSNVFAMDSIIVKESMIPRTEVEAVEDTTDLTTVRDRFIETGFSKLPVFHENIDNIVGVAFAHDLFDNPTSLAEIVRPARFVPASSSSKTLLRDFLNSNTSIAIVMDEYGGMAGIVTREDLLEELFGDIKDEFDADDEILRQLNPTTFLVSGRTDLDTLRDRFEISLEDGDYETVAGYILEARGTIPNQKEDFTIGAYRFTVLRSTANRIDLVRLEKLAPAEPEPQTGIFPTP